MRAYLPNTRCQSMANSRGAEWDRTANSGAHTFVQPLLNADAPACCWARCGWFHPGRPYRKRERPTPVPVPAMCGETLDEGALIQRARQGWRPGEGCGNGHRRPAARMPAPVGYPGASQRVCRLGSGMLGRRQPAVSGLWPLVGVARAWQELAAGDRYQRPGRDRADQQADGREDRH